MGGYRVEILPEWGAQLTPEELDALKGVTSSVPVRTVQMAKACAKMLIEMGGESKSPWEDKS